MVRGKNDRRRKPVKAWSKTARRKPAAQAASDSNTPVLDAAKLRALYAALLECRLLGERLNKLARQGKTLRTPAAPSGLEAAIVGTAMHLSPADFIAPSPSLFLASHIRGCSLDLMFKLLSGNHASPELAASLQLQAAASAALAVKMQPQQAVVLALADDAGTMPGFWHEAVSFAGAHLLPIVFVICTSPDQPALREQALTFGLPGITVDGYDVVAVFRVAQESIRRARQGHGPTLIECKMLPPDSNREGSGDSVAFMEAYLAKRKLWTPAWKNQLTKQIAEYLKHMTGSTSS